MMKFSFLVAVLLVMFSTQVMAFDAAKMFKQTCAACHLIGGGDKTGPDLAGLGKRRKVEWLVKFINYPEGMINGDEEEEGYEKPDAQAKELFKVYGPTIMAEQEMTKEQVEAMIKYIDSVSTTPKGKILKVKNIK